MPAPLGNQFWKLRSKDGRDRTYGSPSELWSVAIDYFQSTDELNIEFQDNKGTKNINVIQRPRPYQKRSFALFAGVSKWATIADHANINQDFQQVIHTIETTIESQQIDGATVGLFKENIISRLIGLTDKSETEVSGINLIANRDEK